MAAMSDRLSGAMAFKALQPLDGGFADLVMTPRRPAAQLAPLHRVDHRTLARSPIRDQLHRRLQPFVTSMTAPVASGWSDLAGWGLHPLESAALSRRTRLADVADSGRSSWGKAVNRVERYRTAAARRAVPTFGSPSPAFGRSHRRAVLALASPEQRLGGRFAMEPSRLVLHSTGFGVRRHGRAKPFRSSRQFLIS
jgi:hypothetical protein